MKYDEIQGLKVFSHKSNESLEIFVCDGAISLGGGILETDASWLDHGWNNTSGNWVDKGWANKGGWGNGRWMDNGWNNDSESWIDNGWTNIDRWIDMGWENSGSGCYVTTACVEYMGLPDNCDELETLRQYRDLLVKSDEGFRKEVLDYYRKAPVVVQKILKSDDKDEQLEWLYNNLVKKCVFLLKNGNFDDAKNHYINVYKELLKKYDC